MRFWAACRSRLVQSSKCVYVSECVYAQPPVCQRENGESEASVASDAAPESSVFMMCTFHVILQPEGGREGGVSMSHKGCHPSLQPTTRDCLRLLTDLAQVKCQQLGQWHAAKDGGKDIAHSRHEALGPRWLKEWRKVWVQLWPRSVGQSEPWSPAEVCICCGVRLFGVHQRSRKREYRSRKPKHRTGVRGTTRHMYTHTKVTSNEKDGRVACWWGYVGLEELVHQIQAAVLGCSHQVVAMQGDEELGNQCNTLRVQACKHSRL